MTIRSFIPDLDLLDLFLLIRSFIPDLGVKILRVSTLIGCFIGSGCEMKKFSIKKIEFVMHMCKKIQSED